MISPITREEVLEGLGESYYCCMFGIRNRTYRCEMWAEILDAVGGVGYLAREEGKVAGQMIFVPKQFARRLCLPTSPVNENMERTMVIGCLYVLPECRNRGIASGMLRRLVGFCREHGYTRIEACVDTRPPDELKRFDLSFSPFRKFGFLVDDAREGWEFNADTRICSLELDEAG